MGNSENGNGETPKVISLDAFRKSSEKNPQTTEEGKKAVEDQEKNTGDKAFNVISISDDSSTSEVLENLDQKIENALKEFIADQQLGEEYLPSKEVCTEFLQEKFPNVSEKYLKKITSYENREKILKEVYEEFKEFEEEDNFKNDEELHPNILDINEYKPDDIKILSSVEFKDLTIPPGGIFDETSNSRTFTIKSDPNTYPKKNYENLAENRMFIEHIISQLLAHIIINNNSGSDIFSFLDSDKFSNIIDMSENLTEDLLLQILLGMNYPKDVLKAQISLIFDEIDYLLKHAKKEKMKSIYSLYQEYKNENIFRFNNSERKLFNQKFIDEKLKSFGFIDLDFLDKILLEVKNNKDLST